MLSRRVDDEPIWLFAYGSLICNPLFEFEERVGATLNGWRRSFCVRLVVARGSHEKPGRMLALEPGGIVQGLALRLPQEHAERELRMIWMHEMVSGIYQPDWADVSLEDGRTVAAEALRLNDFYVFLVLCEKRDVFWQPFLGCIIPMIKMCVSYDDCIHTEHHLL